MEDCSFNFYCAKPRNDITTEQANFNPRDRLGDEKFLGRPAKVGSYPPNKLGLYDMHGNIGQWCQDLYSSDRDMDIRVYRGGSWRSFEGHCRAYSVSAVASDARLDDVGFRLVRTASVAK